MCTCVAGGANGALKKKPTGAAALDQKGSIFSQLSNKIKVLEKNMSLSTRFLESLSAWYIKINITSTAAAADVRAMHTQLHEAMQEVAVNTTRVETMEAFLVELYDVLLHNVTNELREIRV